MGHTTNHKRASAGRASQAHYLGCSDIFYRWPSMMETWGTYLLEPILRLTSCVDDVSIWWHMFNFVLLYLKGWFQFNSRIVRRHFASVMTYINREMFAETRSYIFSLRRRVFLNSNMPNTSTRGLLIVVLAGLCVYGLPVSSTVTRNRKLSLKSLFQLKLSLFKIRLRCLETSSY